MGIVLRYERERERVDEVCRAAGRKPEVVLLLAVSKTVDVEGARQAFEAGARAFGENRPDELMRKAAALPDAAWHFIGNIQSRRIPDIVGASALIHSLYQEKHARKIDEAAARLEKTQDVLIEVNVSGEASKSGVAPEDAAELVHMAVALPHVRVRGLMTMAPAGAPVRLSFSSAAATAGKMSGVTSAFFIRSSSLSTSSRSWGPER